MAELSFKELQDSKNLVGKLGERAAEIGRKVCKDFEEDQESRRGWLEKMEKANELALQVSKDKSYPWTGASNVKFPLITIAALQFASRAYPNLVRSPNLVGMRVHGEDPQGIKAGKAARVSQHMSWQMLEQDENWEEDQDKAFLALPIMGCVFKKSYFDPAKGHNCSKLVLPKSLAVHYYAKDIESAERKTEIFHLYAREIKERQLRGVYADIDLTPPQQEGQTDQNKGPDKRQGTEPPFGDDSAPRTILEQHCYLDLDNDGYPEPYVVTVDKSTEKVLRIVSRFKKVISKQSIQIDDLTAQLLEIQQSMPQSLEGIPPEAQQQALQQAQQMEAAAAQIMQQIESLSAEEPKILRIEPMEYYTKYTFIPSPDGGFYDLGFGMLLGPLNDSVNTLINQLIDAGHMSTGSQGFIGKGARIKGGKVKIKPFEWLRVDATGQQLKDSFVPLPANPPSPVLFNLLGLLVEYTQRIASVTDTIQGENPGQNTPAYNMGAMLEQGLQVFNGIFKRVYRSFRRELQKLYALNGKYLNEREYYEYHDGRIEVLREDYFGDAKDILPAADPNAFSNMEKIQKVVMLKQNAQMVPGYDMVAIEKMWLEAFEIPNPDELFPLQQNPETGQMELVHKPSPSEEFQMESLKEQRLTIDSQERHEREAMLAEAEVRLKELQGLKIIADVEGADQDRILKEMEIALKEIQHLREEETKIEVSENNAARRADSGMDRKSSNS